MDSTNSLDNLAANGIINFDASAYINGTTPRYYGNPQMNVGLPFSAPLFPGPSYGLTAGPLLSGHPSNDAFITKAGSGHTSFSLNKILTAGIVAGLAVAAWNKVKSTFTETKEPSKIGNFIKTQKEKVTSFFNKNKTSEVKSDVKTEIQVEKVAEKEIKEVAKKEVNFFKRNWKKGGIGLVALLGLYGLYQYVSAGKQAQAEQMAALQMHGYQQHETPQNETELLQGH